MRRKILTVLITLLILLTSVITVFAKDFDPDAAGSICVSLQDPYDQTPIPGAELSLYYIATVGINTDEKLNYLYTEPYADTGIALDDPQLVTKLDAYVSQEDLVSAIRTTDEKGKAEFADLPLGLYLIRQTNTVSGFTPCTPFLITLPAENNDGYIYAVNASPKTEAAKLIPITIQKVWNTDNAAKGADSVTVQLLLHDTVLHTAILNEENHWQVTYPDMPQSDAYRIEEVNVPKGFTATYSQKDFIFTVTNTPTLIQTGQIVWPIPVLAVGGMLLLAVGITLLQKKRKTNA